MSEEKPEKTMKTISVSKKGNKAMVVINGDGDSRTLHLQRTGNSWIAKTGETFSSIPEPAKKG